MKLKEPFFSEYKKMTNSEIYDNGSWQYCSLFWLGVAAA
jgi:hypothetical protein